MISKTQINARKLQITGTYANQYMIANLNKFTPGAPPSAGFLYVIEVAPEIAVYDDVTDVFMSNGNYWPSMNVVCMYV